MDEKVKNVIAKYIVAQRPRELFMAIRPLLMRLRIAILVQPNYTSLVPGAAKDDYVLYSIILRRNAIITHEHITLFYRFRSNIEAIRWTNRGLELNIWYKSPQALQKGIKYEKFNNT